MFAQCVLRQYCEWNTTFFCVFAKYFQQMWCVMATISKYIHHHWIHKIDRVISAMMSWVLLIPIPIRSLWMRLKSSQFRHDLMPYNTPIYPCQYWQISFVAERGMVDSDLFVIDLHRYTLFAVPKDQLLIASTQVSAVMNGSMHVRSSVDHFGFHFFAIILGVVIEFGFQIARFTWVWLMCLGLLCFDLRFWTRLDWVWFVRNSALWMCAAVNELYKLSVWECTLPVSGSEFDSLPNVMDVCVAECGYYVRIVCIIVRVVLSCSERHLTVENMQFIQIICKSVALGWFGAMRERKVKG